MSAARPRSPSLKAQLARAETVARIRRFFAEHEALEVSTPAIEPHAAIDAQVRSVGVGDAYLHTSPEYAMKGLVADYRRDIFQIARVFRDESGPRHLREFTLLEWYRVGLDYEQLMRETGELLRALPATRPLCGDIEHIPWRRLCDALGLDMRASDAELAACCARHGFHDCDERADAWDFLATVAAREFDPRRLSFVYDYPPELAQLAVVRDGVAERFEVYAGELELVNGCSELTDLSECERRCAEQNKRRARNRLPAVKPERLLAAVERGLPECAGAALGLDRVLMLALGASVIDEV